MSNDQANLQDEQGNPIDPSAFLSPALQRKEKRGTTIYVIVSMPNGGSFYVTHRFHPELIERITSYLKQQSYAGLPVPEELTRKIDEAFLTLAALSVNVEPKIITPGINLR